MRSPTLRWWLLCTGFVLTGIASVAWVVAEHGGRTDLLLPILYGVVPAAVPLAVASLQSAAFRVLAIVVVLFELFILVWGAWFLIPAILLQLAALFTRRPESARVVARPLFGTLAGTAVLLLVAGFVVIPAGPAAVIGCIDPALPEDAQADTNDAIFDSAEHNSHWEGTSGVSHNVAIELDDWTSDAEVARVVARVRAVDGVTRVVRGDAEACSRSE